MKLAVASSSVVARLVRAGTARAAILRLVTLAGCLLLLAGCWKDRVVWSPDGTRAVILTKDGLQLCDAEGRLTPVLDGRAYRAAWSADAQHLIIATSHPVTAYAELTRLLGPDRSRALATKSEMIWQQWQASEKPDDIRLEPGDDLDSILLYLHANHHDAVLAKFEEKDRAEFEHLSVSWHQLLAATINGDTLERGKTLYEGLASVRDIRPTRDGRAVAFVTPMALNVENDPGLRIWVTRTDGASPPMLLATHVAAHPDWTPDGQALVYLQAEGNRIAGKPDDLRLGTLVERPVFDSGGKLTGAENSRDLVGLIFQDENRVRCLRDGQVLFDAAEFHLPLAGSEALKTREQLYIIDRTKQNAPLTSIVPRDLLGTLPNPLAFFDVSPDEKEVLIGGANHVPVIRLADGQVTNHALAMVDSEDKRNPPLPTWRRPGEFTYLKQGTSRNELVVRHGETETVLSRSWPDAILQRLID